MNEELVKFFREQASVRFIWGKSDCCFFIADWWKIQHGFDPAEEYRGAYWNKKQCKEFLQERGGLLEFFSGLAERAGAVQTDNPKPGDFGIIDVGGRDSAAILGVSGRWVAKTIGGVLGTRRARVIRSWSVSGG